MIHTKMTVNRRACKRRNEDTIFSIVVTTDPAALDLVPTVDARARELAKTGDFDWACITGRADAETVMADMVRVMTAAKA